MHNFKKLKIWTESMKLVSDSYKLTKTFPEFEKFGLVSQMNRCAVSIPSNIAEGSSKSTDKHFSKYLEDSLGSAFEWETQLIIAFNENYLSEKSFNELEQKIKSIQKMISSFQYGLNKS
ncbi:30S ribosomal protein S23 [Tenacibaculum holothuriorum]|uniref:30S ribosomal protein S23 n=1 Tax=Tenacibaculum holothuriorum TaxID=1635173 RepID=A0A1Y2PDG4_9FLAO|nr:four helix bundle protein [Tenacibaculum holothuriorum]OSY88051.1 30S ribosomal protein S23 [Tenacibaculum holothuriorum]